MYGVTILAGLVIIASGQIVQDEGGKYQQQILDVHNDYRKKQGASNMNKLVWDKQLEKEAGDWAKGCRFEHQMKGRGENLAFQTFNKDPDYKTMLDKAMKGWYDEINMYSYSGKSCHASCHYTQMVWAETRLVGCAMNLCPASAFGFGRPGWKAWYFVCFYDPVGNDITQYPYLVGNKPCDKCMEGQSCEDSLCTGKGKMTCDDKEDKCPYWEFKGECQKDKKMMEKNCRRSCNFCEDDDIKVAEVCKDKNPECANYPKTECEKNKAYMVMHCRKTCGFCK